MLKNAPVSPVYTIPITAKLLGDTILARYKKPIPVHISMVNMKTLIIIALRILFFIWE